MPQFKECTDLTTDHLLALNTKLMQSLSEAGQVRVRLMKARDANLWPDMGRATRLFINAQPRDPIP